MVYFKIFTKITVQINILGTFGHKIKYVHSISTAKEVHINTQQNKKNI